MTGTGYATCLELAHIGLARRRLGRDLDEHCPRNHLSESLGIVERMNIVAVRPDHQNRYPQSAQISNGYVGPVCRNTREKGTEILWARAFEKAAQGSKVVGSRVLEFFRNRTAVERVEGFDGAGGAEQLPHIRVRLHVLRSRIEQPSRPRLTALAGALLSGLSGAIVCQPVSSTCWPS